MSFRLRLNRARCSQGEAKEKDGNLKMQLWNQRTKAVLVLKVR